MWIKKYFINWICWFKLASVLPKHYGHFQMPHQFWPKLKSGFIWGLDSDFKMFLQACYTELGWALWKSRHSKYLIGLIIRNGWKILFWRSIHYMYIIRMFLQKNFIPFMKSGGYNIYFHSYCYCFSIKKCILWRKKWHP